MDSIKRRLSPQARSRLERALEQEIMLLNMVSQATTKEPTTTGHANVVCVGAEEEGGVVEVVDDEEDRPVAKRTRSENTVQLVSSMPTDTRSAPIARKFRFFVQGNGDSSYIVYFSAVSPRHPTCSCEDFQRRKENCKHVFYVIFRVLFRRVSAHMATIGKLLFCDGTDAVGDEDVALWKAIETAAADAARTEQFDNLEGGSMALQKTDCVCGICLDTVVDTTDIGDVVWCIKQCGSFFHRGCIAPWLEKSTNCPMCRAPWSRWRNVAKMGGQWGWLP